LGVPEVCASDGEVARLDEVFAGSGVNVKGSILGTIYDLATLAEFDL
jgi:hypothetical protein